MVVTASGRYVNEVTVCYMVEVVIRDRTGSGFLTRDPTRPDPVVERCKQILDNDLIAVYLLGLPVRIPKPFSGLIKRFSRLSESVLLEGTA